MSVEIEVRNGRVFVSSPYHPEFPGAAKAIGGRWTRDSEDGLTEPETVTVRYTVTHSDDNPLWIAGRKAVWRAGRDFPVRLGDGVVVVEGSFPPTRRGSLANPRIIANAEDDPVTIEIRDVPRELVASDADNGVFEIVAEDEGQAPAPSPFEAYVQAMAIVGDMRKGLDLVDEQIEDLADCIIRLYPGKAEEL